MKILRISNFRVLFFLLTINALICSNLRATPFAKIDIGCMRFLIEVQNKLGVADREEDFGALTAPDTVSVKLENTERAIHGGQILTLKKISPYWFSTHTSVKYDSQGDPRRPLDAFGKTFAEFLGFKIVDHETLKIPDPTEIIKTLRLANQKLHSLNKPLIPVGFYLQKENSAEYYVRRFADHLELPLHDPSLNLNHYLHDVGFHLPFSSVPFEIAGPIAEKYRIILHFMDDFFNQRATKKLISKENIAIIKRKLFYKMSVGIDEDNGDFSTAFSSADPAESAMMLSMLYVSIGHGFLDVATAIDWNAAHKIITDEITRLALLKPISGYLKTSDQGQKALEHLNAQFLEYPNRYKPLFTEVPITNFYKFIGEDYFCLLTTLRRDELHDLF